MARLMKLSALLLGTSVGVEGRAFMEASDLSEAVSTAMDEVLGCGQQRADPNHLQEIRRLLEPMWRTMPSSDGRLDWRSVRYVAHRFFMQRSSMVVRGFEPSRLVAEGSSGAADILSRSVPEHADLLFGGAHSKSGFAFDDVVALLAGLERMVVDSEMELLESVYKSFGMHQRKDLTSKQVRKLLETYMVNWMLGEDKQAIAILLQNQTLLADHFPHWHAIRGFVDGRIRTMDFNHALAPQGHGRSLLDGRYAFADVHEVVGGITQSFQVFWESECADMKATLVSMDVEGTGRVSLSDFYGPTNEEIRFGESESYLRELGLLDETSPWKGKQVLIANYLQAANNCIISSKNYLVCCSNQCEQLLGDIEEHVGAPFGSPEQVLDVVANMSSPSSVDDEPPKITEALREQLTHMAKNHGGQVPLHGRLFAQFLHYVFPWECAFPHRAGSFASHTLTPDNFEGFMSSEDERTKHVQSSQDAVDAPADTAELQMWSEDEELFADYSSKSDSSWKFFLLALALVSGLILKTLSMMEAKSEKAKAPLHDLLNGHCSKVQKIPLRGTQGPLRGTLDVASPCRPVNSHFV